MKRKGLEAAKELIKCGVSDALRYELEKNYPELKESEDERIRKELINYFIKGKEYLSLCSFSKEEILAWLEKQGEQKPITIDIDKMVSKYSHTKDRDFGLPVNCQIRAYRQGINDALNLSLGIKKQGEQKPTWSEEDGCYMVQIPQRLNKRRIVMKANEAPEKIYVALNELTEDGHTFVLDHRVDYPICTEYTRTDAFIEKACEWLKEQDEIIGISFTEDFILRFKNYMKRE